MSVLLNATRTHCIHDHRVLSTATLKWLEQNQLQALALLHLLHDCMSTLQLSLDCTHGYLRDLTGRVSLVRVGHERVEWGKHRHQLLGVLNVEDRVPQITRF